jgi:hypothetical protein
VPALFTFFTFLAFLTLLSLIALWSRGAGRAILQFGKPRIDPHIDLDEFFERSLLELGEDARRFVFGSLTLAFPLLAFLGKDIDQNRAPTVNQAVG